MHRCLNEGHRPDDPFSLDQFLPTGAAGPAMAAATATTAATGTAAAAAAGTAAMPGAAVSDAVVDAASQVSSPVPERSPAMPVGGQQHQATKRLIHLLIHYCGVMLHSS